MCLKDWITNPFFYVSKEGTSLKRIAFITESSSRKETATVAYEFYRSPRSQWVNKIIDYMEIRDFPKENIYFLSFQEMKIFSYEEIIQPYPKGEKPAARELKSFLKKVTEFIEELQPHFVEFHTAKGVISPLVKRLEGRIPYRIYAEEAALGQKAKAYTEMILEEQNLRKLKEIQREKWTVLQEIKYLSANETETLLTKIRPKAPLYGIEENVNELTKTLKKFRENYRAAIKAKNELEAILEDADDQLIMFIQSISSISELFTNLPQYEMVKSQFGKEIAKLIRYLLKHEYMRKEENRIQEGVLRLQIALLK